MGAIQSAINQSLVLGGAAARAVKVDAEKQLEAAEGRYVAANEMKKYAAKEAIGKVREYTEAAGVPGPKELDEGKLEAAEQASEKIRGNIHQIASRGGILGLKKAAGMYAERTARLGLEVNKYQQQTAKAEEALKKVEGIQKAKAEQKARIEAFRKQPTSLGGTVGDFPLNIQKAIYEQTKGGK